MSSGFGPPLRRAVDVSDVYNCARDRQSSQTCSNGGLRDQEGRTNQRGRGLSAVRDLCLPTVWRLYKTTWSASLSTTTALSRPRHVSFGRRGEWRGEWHHQDVNVVSSSTLIHQTSLREGTRLEFWSPVRLWHAGCIMQGDPLSRATPPQFVSK
jgi:hypothetical protein